MKKIYYLILSFVAVMSFPGCSNDDDVAVDAIDSSLFEEAGTFTDPRDGHVYKYIKVGNQMWMAENLAFYVEGGSTVGCFTWDEEPYVAPKGGIPLDDEEWKEAMIDFADNTEPYKYGVMSFGFDPATGSFAPIIQHMGEMISQYENMSPPMPLEVIKDIILGEYSQWILNYPNFKSDWEAVLVAKMEEKTQKMIPTYAKEQSVKTDAENGNYSQKYGYLYSLDAARKAVPPGGWRLPSDEDWKKLERALGMSESEVERNNAWRGINAGDYLKEGGISMFEAKLAGCNAYVGGVNGQNYINLKEGGYFWTNEETVTETNGETLPTDENNKEEEEGSGTGDSDEEEENGLIREGVCRFVSIYSSQIWRGVTRLDNGYRETTYSVRCVKDIN